MASIIVDKFGLHFGALAPSISDQLDSQGWKGEPADLLQWQKDSDAITRLAVRRMLPDSQAHAARKRLMKHITRGVKKVVPEVQCNCSGAPHNHEHGCLFAKP